MHLRLDGVVVDQQTIGARYDALCSAGTAVACKWRAWDEWGRVRRDPLLRILDAACGTGDAGACTALGVALVPSDEARATTLLRAACDAGQARGCLELGRLQDDPALRARACELGLADACGTPSADPAADCAAGRTSACEAVLPAATGADRLRVLERLCHAGVRCEELARERAAGDRGTLQAKSPARSTWIEGGVLLGWDLATFTDHAYLPVADLDHAELVVEGTREEHFVLAPATGEPIAVAEQGCDNVVAGAKVLAAGGKLVRAHAPDGAPTTSDCLTVFAPSTTYRSGRLEVGSEQGEEDAGGVVRAGMLAAADGLWRCAEATPLEAHLAPWVVTVAHSRAGPPAKVTTTASTGRPDVDACLEAWLRGVALGATSYKSQHEVRLELTW